MTNLTNHDAVKVQYNKLVISYDKPWLEVREIAEIESKGVDGLVTVAAVIVGVVVVIAVVVFVLSETVSAIIGTSFFVLGDETGQLFSSFSTLFD